MVKKQQQLGLKLKSSTQYAYKLQLNCKKLRASLAKELLEMFGEIQRDFLATL